MASPPDHTADAPPTTSSGAEWAALLFAGVLLVAFRMHAFDLPLETDECNYAYIGARLLEGDRLYVDVWDHQPFGVFALFAGVIALFGDAPIVFRCMATAFSLASLGLVFGMLRSVAGSGPAVLGALIFAIASSDPGTAGEGCNREIYMNTLILAAWYFALRPGPPKWWAIFAAGCALAVASSIKTIVAVHWLLLAVWIIYDLLHRTAPPARLGTIATRLLLLAAPPLILWLLTALYFAATGRWAEFLDAVFLFNLSYSGTSESFLTRFARFFSPPRHPFAFDSALPLWIGAAVSVPVLIVRSVEKRCRPALAVLVLLAAGFVAVCLPNRFWPHYYHLLIPPAVIAVAAAAGCVARWGQTSVKSRSTGNALAALVYALVPACLLVTEYREYLSQPLFGITAKRYNSRDFWGRAHGENVRKVTDPSDSIFVFGNDTSIYYYADRRCASRYTMITGIQAAYAGSKRRRATLMSELEQNPPRLILVLFDEKPFPEWRTFLENYYTDPVGWDYNDKTDKPIMFVVVRKDSPIERIDWNWDRAQVGGW